MKKTIIVAENNKLIHKEMTLEECIQYYSDTVKLWSYSCYDSARRMSHNIMDADDFYSEGMIRLIRVYDNYQPKNTFSTNLLKGLDNLKIDLFRKLNSKKRKTENTLVPLNEEQNSRNDIVHREPSLGYYDNNLLSVEFTHDMDKVKECLSFEERTIFNFLLNQEDITKRTVSKQLNVSRPTLDKRIPRVQSKILTIIPEYLM